MDTNVLTVFRPLYESEREAAWEVTKLRIAGPKPVLDANKATNTKYPREVTRTIKNIVTLVLVAAFVPSSLRIFIAGYHSFGNTMGDNTAFFQFLVGASSVLLAEAGQVISTMALAVLETDTFSRRLLWVSAFAFSSIAMVGNYEVAKPAGAGGLFPYLEAIFPTVLVSAMAYVRKQLWLDDISDSYADKKDYELKQLEWQDRYDTAEEHEKWSNYYANTLRDTMRRVYTKNYPSLKESLAELSLPEWGMLVSRERNAANWWKEYTTVEMPVMPSPDQLGAGSALAVDNSAPTVFLTDPADINGTWTAACSHCTTVVGTTYKSKRSAFGARRQHVLKEHPNL